MMSISSSDSLYLDIIMIKQSIIGGSDDNLKTTSVISI